MELHSLPSHAVRQPRIKFCGYLRKKRKKKTSSGWCKMWFVLQDQLLLSYNSQQDYDRKLVSFKDVLNLTPGAVVRPLDDLQFVIETATLSVHMFRCDDPIAYREWISKLLSCLHATAIHGSSAGLLRSAEVVQQRALPHREESRNRCQWLHCKPLRQGETYEERCLRAKPALVRGASFLRSIQHKVEEAECILRRTKDPAITSASSQERKQSNSEAGTVLMRDKILRLRLQGDTNEIIMEETLESLKKCSLQEKLCLVTEATVEEQTLQPAHAAGKQEPVYAVVDLKSKYARRKQAYRDKCASYESIAEPVIAELAEAIYEDEADSSQFDASRQEEENIYEPINISNSSTGNFLTYLNRLKANSLQLLRVKHKRTDEDRGSTEKCLDFAYTNAETDQKVQRKSLKTCVQKFCLKDYEPKPVYKHHQQSSIAEEAPTTTVGFAVRPLRKLQNHWKTVRLNRRNRNPLYSATKLPKWTFGTFRSIKKERATVMPKETEVNNEKAHEVERVREASVE